MQQIEFLLHARPRGFHLITHEILQHLPELPECGILHLFIQHTSAALSLNENADPDVQTDLAASFDHLIRENEHFYTHTCEGADDMPAHIKSTMVGASVTIPITNHRLNLGTWQGIYLCEFRNKASCRHIIATIL
ncbi:MAG TPA: secondary thiamine-phosphate synthase enzyme YjbQ [Paludibacteraceae bacterium]|nr:secondary thiamine-phosphate synthase enzyme YjbQ [Paludibacteraceae bacterium]HRS68239.1 secondary thiamine-phosphate synthase enzyme YjbQ [Paludibacteraceae bacterium]